MMVMNMKAAFQLAVAGIAAACMGQAVAAVSAEEAAQLGKTLTPWGAEIAANKDGTIPAYPQPWDGSAVKKPAKWDSKKAWVMPTPFPDDKVLLTITGKNADEYADKLTPGQMALLKKYPSYRIDVYPSRRWAPYPQWVQDNTIKNATRCQTIEGGTKLDVSKGCYGGIPFPIPKTGYEVMWNKQLHWRGFAWSYNSNSYYSDGAGRVLLGSQGDTNVEEPFYDPKKTSLNDEGTWYRISSVTLAPDRIAGQGTMFMDNVDGTKGRRAWSYQPGQRRVRLAPDVCCDTPIPSNGNTSLYDDQNIWLGVMDRFDFKLIGKKEIYMPYNTHKMWYECKPEEVMGPNHLNPDCMRWELHRVWVVEAALKPGKRHLYSKKVIYVEEDSFAGMSDVFDQGGKLFRTGQQSPAFSYVDPVPISYMYGFYDLAQNNYSMCCFSNTAKGYIKYKFEPQPTELWNPDNLVRSGVR